MMTPARRLLITPGEPAGIGPDITIQLAQQDFAVEIVAVADPALLTERASQLGLPLSILPCDVNDKPTPHRAQQLKVIPISLKQTVTAGKLNPANARYVLRTLETAATLCLSRQANAIVTGPVHKGVMNDAGIPFSGHTEFFAKVCNVPQTIMLFVVDQLRVALATTHLPLSAVPSAITQEKLAATLRLLNSELQKQFHLNQPNILVCGLNPHAGENGHLGREEIETISPAIAKLREQGLLLEGPLPADTIFTPPFMSRADVILGMYHDQVLPVVKNLGFGHAVNVTLGLPFIRTSVDHGTALDAAGSGKADASSLQAAMKLAEEMIELKNRRVD